MARTPRSPEEIERGRRLGAKIKEARGSIPREDFAQMASIRFETLKKIEEGVAGPSVFAVYAIAVALGEGKRMLKWLEGE